MERQLQRQLEEEQLGVLVSQMQLFLHVSRTVEVNREVLPGRLNLQVKCKQYGVAASDRLESHVMWNRQCPDFDLRVVSPMNLEVLMKTAETPWIIELYTVGASVSLVGIVKLRLD